MLTDSRFHRRGNTQRLMNAAKVVVCMKQRKHGDVVFELLTEGVRQPGEAPHIHPHVEVLPLHVACADMLMVRGAYDIDSFGPKTLRRAVARLSFGITAIDLDQLSVIDIGSEGVRDGNQIHFVAVRGQLDSVRQTAFNIPKKLRRTPGVPPSYHPGDYELALGLNGRERPNVTTDTGFHLFRRDVLLLASDKRPDFIDLNPLGRRSEEHTSELQSLRHLVC